MKKLHFSVFSSVLTITLITNPYEKLSTQAIILHSTLKITNAVSGSGNAGIAYTGTEYWVEKWYTDSIATLSPSGNVRSRFVIASVDSKRNVTWDVN